MLLPPPPPLSYQQPSPTEQALRDEGRWVDDVRERLVRLSRAADHWVSRTSEKAVLHDELGGALRVSVLMACKGFGCRNLWHVKFGMQAFSISRCWCVSCLEQSFFFASRCASCLKQWVLNMQPCKLLHVIPLFDRQGCRLWCDVGPITKPVREVQAVSKNMCQTCSTASCCT